MALPAIVPAAQSQPAQPAARAAADTQSWSGALAAAGGESPAPQAASIAPGAAPPQSRDTSQNTTTGPKKTGAQQASSARATPAQGAAVPTKPGQAELAAKLADGKPGTDKMVAKKSEQKKKTDTPPAAVAMNLSPVMNNPVPDKAATPTSGSSSTGQPGPHDVSGTQAANAQALAPSSVPSPTSPPTSPPTSSGTALAAAPADQAAGHTGSATGALSHHASASVPAAGTSVPIATTAAVPVVHGPVVASSAQALPQAGQGIGAHAKPAAAPTAAQQESAVHAVAAVNQTSSTAASLALRGSFAAAAPSAGAFKTAADKSSAEPGSAALGVSALAGGGNNSAPAAAPVQTAMPQIAAATPTGATGSSAAALAATVTALHQAGQSGAVLRLDPPGLGTLSVHVGLSGLGQVNVLFVPSTAQGAQALQAGLPGLSTAMAQSGLVLGQAQVGGQFGQNAGQGGGQSPNGQGRAAFAAPDAPVAATTATAATAASTNGLSAYA